MRKLILFIALLASRFKAEASEVCSELVSPNICCSANYEQCVTCSSQCTGGSSSCDSSQGDCSGSVADCTSALSPKTLSQTQFYILEGESSPLFHGQTWTDIFTNAYPNECPIHKCNLFILPSGSAAPDPSGDSNACPTYGQCNVEDQTGEIVFSDPQVSFDNFFYLACATSGFATFAPSHYIASVKFIVSTTTCVEDDVVLDAVAGSVEPQEYYSTVGIDDPLQLVFSDIEDSNSCNEFTLRVWETGGSTVSPDVQVTRDSANDQIVFTPRNPITASVSFSFRLVADFGLFTRVFENGDDTFVWNIKKCTAAGETVDSWGPGLSATQFASLGCTNCFELPGTTISDSRCAIQSYKAYGTNGAIHPGLEDPFESAGKVWVKMISTNSFSHNSYTFIVRGIIDGGVDVVFPQSTLVVGCPTSYAQITQSAFYPNALTDTQWVDCNAGAATKFYLPQFISSAASCPITTRLISTTTGSFSSTSSINAPILESPYYYAEPSDKTLHLKYEFYVRVNVVGAPSFFYSTLMTFVVGCPAADVTLAEGVFPGSRDPIQFVALNSPIFYLPEITVTGAPSGKCSIDSRRISSSTGSFTAMSEMNAPSFIAACSCYRTSVASTPVTTPSTFEFYYVVQVDSANGGPEIYSQVLKLMMGCEPSFPILTTTTATLTVAAPDFLFGSATTPSIPGCTIAAYKLFDGAGIGKSEITDLTTPVYSHNDGLLSIEKFSYISNSMAATQVHIGVQMQDSSVWFFYPNALTISVAAGPCTTTTLSADESGITTQQYATSADPKFNLPVFSSSNPNCAITAITPVPSSGSTTQSSGLNYTPLPHQIVGAGNDIAYDFYVYVQASGSPGQHFGPYKLRIGCPNDPSFNSISLTFFPGGFGMTQRVQASNSGTTPTLFVLPNWSVDISQCGVDLAQTAYFSDAAASWPLSTGLLNLPSFETVGGSSVHGIVPNDIASDDEIDFYVRLKTRNGATLVIGGYKLVCGCPSTYGGQTMTLTPFPGGISDVQGVSLNDAVNSLFRYPVPTIDMTYCPFSVTKISSSSVFLNEPAGYTYALITSAGLTILTIAPPDISTPQVLQFYAYFKQMNKAIFSPQLTLILGCPVAELTFNDPPPTLPLYQTITVDSGNIANAYTQPAFTTSHPSMNWQCQIASVAMVDVRKNNFPAPPGTAQIDPACSANPLCTNIVVAPATDPDIIKFKFQITMAQGGQTYTSPDYTVEWRCAQGSTNVFFPPGTVGPFDINVGDTAPLVLPDVICSVPACCTSLTVQASTLSNTAFSTPPLVSSVTRSGGQILIAIDTTAVATADFYVHAFTSTADSATPIPVHVEVKVACNGDVIIFSKNPPLPEEQAKLGSLGMLSLQEDGSFRVSVAMQTGQVDVLQIDIGVRFASLVDACPLSSYRIAKVVNQTSGQEAPKDIWAEMLSVSGDGIMELNRTDQAFEFEVFLEAFNGARWSNSTEMGSLVKITLSADPVQLPNVAPQFTSSLSTNQFTIDPSTASSLLLPLPFVYDANFDKVAITLVNAPAFISLDLEQKALVVDETSLTHSSNQTVDLLLKDLRGGSSSYSFNFEFTVRYANGSTPEELSLAFGKPMANETSPGLDIKLSELELRFVPPVDLHTELVAAWISSIDYFGVLKIGFNASMRADFEWALINENNVNITVKARETGMLLHPSWKVIGFRSDQLTIKLNFTDPLLVSKAEEQDMLTVRISSQARQFLYSPVQQRYLHEDYLVLQKKIRRQLEDSLATRSLDKGAEAGEMSLTLLLVITFSLNVVLKGGMRYMLMMIRCLQMILHLPLLQIIFPANASALFSKVVPIVAFDVLDPEWTTKFILKFDEPLQSKLQSQLRDQMVDLGYETHNSILNLGSLSIFVTIYLMEGLLVIAFRLYEKLTSKKVGLVQAVQNRLLFGDLIAILVDAYFEFLISGYLALDKPLFTENGEVTSVVFGYLSLALALGFVPFVMSKVLLASPTEIESEQFRGRWGQAYESVKTTSKWTLGYFPVFIMRRLLFFALAFYAYTYPQLQLVALLLLNMAIFIYQGRVMPLATKQFNRIEIVNECFICLVSYHLLMFTQWVESPGVQFNCGWSMILAVALIIVINLQFVIRNGFYLIVLLATKYFRKLKARLEQTPLVQVQIALQNDELVERQTPTDDEIEADEREFSMSPRSKQSEEVGIDRVNTKGKDPSADDPGQVEIYRQVSKSLSLRKKRSSIAKAPSLQSVEIKALQPPSSEIKPALPTTKAKVRSKVNDLSFAGDLEDLAVEVIPSVAPLGLELVEKQDSKKSTKRRGSQSRKQDLPKKSKRTSSKRRAKKSPLVPTESNEVPSASLSREVPNVPGIHEFMMGLVTQAELEKDFSRSLFSPAKKKKKKFRRPKKQSPSPPKGSSKVTIQ